jgi:hypothetical protein
MPNRPYPAIDALVRRVKRLAAERPDPAHILAEIITMIGASETDPYVILGVLVEGTVQTVVRHIPTEQQAEASATLVELLAERLNAHGLPDPDR